MKRSILIIIVLTAVLLFAAVSGALAETDTVTHYPSEGYETCATTKQKVNLSWGWAACSVGLTNDFIDSSSNTVTINGVLISEITHKDTDFWGEITPYDGTQYNFPSDCLWEVAQGFVSRWTYPLGKLDAGDYEILYTTELSYPVVDGGDWDGDGNIDSFEGPFIRHSTLHIVEDVCP